MNFKTGKQLAGFGFALCSVALMGAAGAQQPTNGSEQQQPQQQQQPAAEPPPVAGRVTLGMTVEATELIATGWRASKLLRADVFNDKGQKIGKVDDFIVAPDGTVSVAILDIGGFLGIGAHRVAVPVKQFAKVGPKVVLNGATKEALKQMPEFKYQK